MGDDNVSETVKQTCLSGPPSDELTACLSYEVEVKGGAAAQGAFTHTREPAPQSTLQTNVRSEPTATGVGESRAAGAPWQEWSVRGGFSALCEHQSTSLMCARMSYRHPGTRSLPTGLQASHSLS